MYGTLFVRESLKQQCHKIFYFMFFSWWSLPGSPDKSNSLISHFLNKILEDIGNWRRTTGVNGRWEKNLTESYFIFSLESTVYIAFYTEYVILTLCQRHTRKIYRRCYQHTLILERAVTICVIDSPPLPVCCWHRRPTLSCEYLSVILKNFKTILTELESQASWRKLIQGKNLKSKILWHCPLKYHDGTIKNEGVAGAGSLDEPCLLISCPLGPQGHFCIFW